MLKATEDADLTRRLDGIKLRSVEPGEVAAVLEAVLASLSGDMSVNDLTLYRELEQIARYIQSAKREIAEIQPRDISEQHIPMATDELDAVVTATAEATGTILDAAETMEKLAPAMPPEMRDRVAASVTRIYEASNFQDITGQRITKVVKTLKYIETKIDALLTAFGDGNDEWSASAPAPLSPHDDRRLMNGPQLPANANNQDDIDALLAELDGK